MNWLKRWDVPSSDWKRTYKVAIDDKGNYGCSCPAWKYQRKQCKHIRRIQAQEQYEQPRTSEDFKIPAKTNGSYKPQPTQPVKVMVAAKPVAIIPSKPVGRFFNFDD
jgi:hypothetical protein